MGVEERGVRFTDEFGESTLPSWWRTLGLANLGVFTDRNVSSGRFGVR